MKEGSEKEESKQGWTCTWRVRELKQGSDHHIWGIVWDAGKHLRLLESAAIDLWQSEWSENHTDDPRHIHMYPRQECKSSGMHGGWELKCRDWGAIPGWGLLLTAGRWPRGTWGRRLQRGLPLEESQVVMEVRWYCWVTCRGCSHHCSLSPHMPAD